MGLILGWLIPGAGFMLYGRWGRGLIHFVMISLTFAFGLALHSSVAWPTWSIHSEEFNLINNFTFIVQLGSGALALGSFMASISVGGATGPLGWLAGIPQHPYYELGSYFLIVAGALNYFAIGNFYDRFMNPHPRVAHPKSPAAEASK